MILKDKENNNKNQVTGIYIHEKQSRWPSILLSTWPSITQRGFISIVKSLNQDTHPLRFQLICVCWGSCLDGIAKSKCSLYICLCEIIFCSPSNLFKTSFFSLPLRLTPILSLPSSSLSLPSSSLPLPPSLSSTFLHPSPIFTMNIFVCDCKNT